MMEYFKIWITVLVVLKIAAVTADGYDVVAKEQHHIADIQVGSSGYTGDQERFEDHMSDGLHKAVIGLSVGCSVLFVMLVTAIIICCKCIMCKTTGSLGRHGYHQSDLNYISTLTANKQINATEISSME